MWLVISKVLTVLKTKMVIMGRVVQSITQLSVYVSGFGGLEVAC